MGLKYNPLTGELDLVGPGSSSTFDPDTILCDNNFEAIFDEDGNILVEQ